METLLDEMTKCDFMRHRSFLSKIAAFARPDVFIAYDSYARKGLVNLRVVEREPDDYQTYLKAVRKLSSKIGKDIEKHLEGRSLPTGNGKAHQLRILDVHLMLVGGRKIPIKSNELLHFLKRNPSGFRLF